jgi:hypothetical protein
MTRITVRPGAYVVNEIGRGGLRTFWVSKDETCTCGGTARTPCRHIEAVAEYLQAGGERAPQAQPAAVPQTPSPAGVPDARPICGAEIRLVDPGGYRPLWRRQADASHY